MRDVVEKFRRQHDLQNKPLFFTGCSCEFDHSRGVAVVVAA